MDRIDEIVARVGKVQSMEGLSRIANGVDVEKLSGDDLRKFTHALDERRVHLAKLAVTL